MSLYVLPTPDCLPEIVVSHWSVRRTRKGDHIVGRDIADRDARASTAIQHFDAARATATTSSGRRYVLQGAPGRTHDSEYVWKRWCRVNSVVEDHDVSEDYVQQILAAPRPEALHTGVETEDTRR